MGRQALQNPQLTVEDLLVGLADTGGGAPFHYAALPQQTGFT